MKFRLLHGWMRRWQFVAVVFFTGLVLSLAFIFSATVQPAAGIASIEVPTDEELLIDPDFYSQSTWTVDRIEMLGSGVDALGYGFAAWGTFFKRDTPPVKEIQIMNVDTIHDKKRAIGLKTGDRVRLFKHDWKVRPRIFQEGDFRIVLTEKKPLKDND